MQMQLLREIDAKMGLEYRSFRYSQLPKREEFVHLKLFVTPAGFHWHTPISRTLILKEVIGQLHILDAEWLKLRGDCLVGIRHGGLAQDRSVIIHLVRID